MGLLLLLRILVPAPAVHIVGADRRVVVPRDSRNPSLFEQRHCLVRPWRIPDQVAENQHLARVFEDLFTPGGHEIYLKPAKDYVRLDTKLPYHAVVEAALKRGEVALGIRRAASSRDSAASFGVVVNPAKDRDVTLTAADKVIVLADD